MATAVDEQLDIGRLPALIAIVDPTLLGDDELARLVVDSEQALNAMHALSAVALEEFERRGAWAGDGGGLGGRSHRHGQGGAAGQGALSPQHLTALAAIARRRWRPC